MNFAKFLRAPFSQMTSGACFLIKLEEKLKELEISTISDLNDNQENIECKTKLEKIYQIKVDGIKTTSKCNWYDWYK